MPLALEKEGSMVKLGEKSIPWSKQVRMSFLRLSKKLGLFHLARRLTGRGLRILCYHNFADDDVTVWQPGLSMHPTTFSKRMKFLQEEQFAILSLGEAIKQLEQHQLPPCATVITIDDGWYSIKQHAHPILTQNSFKYTVYVTTYYCVKERPIFNLIVPYMFWKSGQSVIDLAGLGLPVDDVLNVQSQDHLKKTVTKIINFGDQHMRSEEKDQLARELGRRLGVDYERLSTERALNLLTCSEVKEVAKAGADIQLHAHRHCWPLDRHEALKEIEENRAVLGTLVDGPCKHFCYPSGVWSVEQFSYLQEAGVETATTCERGLNYRTTNHFALKRFLDAENVSQLEFEAEMMGFMECLRFMRNRVTRAVSIFSRADRGIRVA